MRMKKREVLYVLLTIFFIGCSPSEFKPNPVVSPQINQEPIAIAKNITLNKNTTKAITLSGTDPNGDKLTYTVDKLPNNGVFEDGIYTPNQNYYGSDSFSFIANDGFLNSKPAVIHITIEDNSATCKSLHKTGQTISYYNNDDGNLQKGATRSYTRDDEAQTVTDNVTGLMWQDDVITKKIWVTQENYDNRKYLDTSGNTAITYCENLTLYGYEDWRLPTYSELYYLSDKGRVDPAIDSLFQNIISSEGYWSSITTNNASSAWVVKDDGNSHDESKNSSSLVRCVRGKNKITHNFVRDNTKEVVIDTETCLMWQDNIDTKTVQKTWQEAINYCDDLNFANFNDWRLPNINELYTTFDTYEYGKGFKSVFVNVDWEYWSSTTIASTTRSSRGPIIDDNSHSGSSDYAWTMYDYRGAPSSSIKSYTDNIRCVRLSK